MSDVFEMIAGERRAIADLLEQLDDAQWDADSLCAGWRVRDVAAHLTMPFCLSVPGMLLRLVANRFDYDRVALRWAREQARPTAELVDLLRTNAAHRFTPPGLGPEAPLTDLVVHGQDIARPLGIDRTVAAEVSAVALDFLVSPKAARGFVPRGRTDGLALAATDTGWHHGQGAEVSGPAIALLLAVGGRPSALGELSGDGVAELRRRIER